MIELFKKTKLEDFDPKGSIKNKLSNVIFKRKND
jgi:hypothetical protein